MKQCECGCSVFACHRIVKMEQDVEFDMEGNQIDWVEDGDIVDSEYPEGPFVCLDCGAEYETEDDIPDVPDDEEEE